MKTYRTEQVPATTREMLERVVCDLCHEEIEGVRLHSPYRIDDIAVRRHVGSDYPEGGMGTDEEFDVCGECWGAVIVPLFKSHGSEPRVEEWEW